MLKRSTALFVALAFSLTLLLAQPTASVITSPASQLSKPAVFDLVEGESLKVVPQGPAGLSFDIFVYDESTHDLAGRSNDDSTEAYFL